MKRLLALLLAIGLLFCLWACGNTQDSPATTTEEPDIFRSLELIKDPSSKCTILHDGTMYANEFAYNLKMILSANYGVEATSNVDTGEEHDGVIIVVGNTGIGEKTAKKLRPEQDFAIKVEENALVLCAADQLSYNYLQEYLTRGLFGQNETGILTVDSDDNVIYSQSALTEKNYIEYMYEKDKFVSWDKLFAYKEYKNADTVLPYRIYVPFNYTADKKIPLLVNLHGAGLRGNDNQKHLKFIDTMLLQTQLPVDEAIVVFPQCPENQKWVDSNWSMGSYSLATTPESNELKAVVELVQQLMQTYPVDEDRIYACGFSMGGYGTWNLLMNHPDLFAAGVPMCGAGDPKQAEVLKDIPIWAIHGALDPTVPVQGSRDMHDAIKAVGGEKIKYTELPNYEHDVWNYTYGNIEIFQWLFDQKKG